MRHPDAAVLRELAGSNDSFSACLADDQSRWAISIISADQVSRDHVVDQTLGEEDGMTEVRKERIAALKAVQPVELVTSSTVGELTKSAQDTANQNIGDEGADTVALQQEETRLINEVDQRLSWTYPYEAATQIAASTSVTELKTLLAMQDIQSVEVMEELGEQSETLLDHNTPGINHTKDEASHVLRGISSELNEHETGSRLDSNGTVNVSDAGSAGTSFKLHLRRPKFMEATQLTGAERGNVYHTLMQHLPIDGTAIDLQLIEQTIQRLVELQILLSHHAEVIEPEELVGFFDTEPGKELLRAAWVKREIPFVYGLPAHQSPAEWLHERAADSDTQMLKEDSKMQATIENETVLVQGIIDCLYEVDGELVLLDYKTDRVLEHRGGLDELTKNYRFQLDLYGRAIEDILGRKVDRKWLYFLMVDMQWNCKRTGSEIITMDFIWERGGTDDAYFAYRGLAFGKNA